MGTVLGCVLAVLAHLPAGVHEVMDGGVAWLGAAGKPRVLGGPAPHPRTSWGQAAEAAGLG